MLTATVKQSEEVVAFITAPNQGLLDRALLPYPDDQFDIEIEGEPEAGTE